MRRRNPLSALAATLVVAASLGPALLAFSAPLAGAAPEVAPPVSGVWRTDDGAVFEMTVTGSTGSFESTVLDDECTGGPRTMVLRGTGNGSSMEGTMQRCDAADHPLVVGCGLDPLWETPFTANYTAYEIVGERRGEWYDYDTLSDGSIANCTFDHYFWTSFSYMRLDCPLYTFEGLAERYGVPEAERADDVARAQRMENGEALQWTEAQLAAGGLKEKVDVLRAGFLTWGFSSSVNSAYRPVSYQGHFADLRRCGFELLNNIRSYPEAEPFLASSVAKVKAEIAKHGLAGEDSTAGSTTIRIPYVCWREPLTDCPHVDQRAVDLSIVGDNNESLEWIGAMYGFCRPYRDKDRPHWDYVGDYPFGVEKCKFLGRGPGEATITFEGHSPINIMVEDPYGNAVGFDPTTGTEVNDLGESAAYYSGAGTEPQVIQIFAGAGALGNYTLSGVGTGNGSYTLSATVADLGGTVVDGAELSGTAVNGTAIAPFRYEVKEDYAAPFPWRLGRFVSATPAGAIIYEVDTAGGTVQVEVAAAGAPVVYSTPASHAIVLTGGTGGGPTTLVVPAAAVGGSMVVRADGTPVTATQRAQGSSVAITFERPPGAVFVTVEGVSGSGAVSPSNGGGTAPAAGGDAAVWLVVAAAAAASVGAAVYFVQRRKKTG